MDTTTPTLPPADDVLALPHFEERLLAALRDRHATGTWSRVPAATDSGAVPGGGQLEATAGTIGDGAGIVELADPRAVAGRRAGTRFGTRRRALAVAAAVLAVGAVAVAVQTRGGDTPDVGTAADTPSPSTPGDPEGGVALGPEEQRIHDTLSEALASSVVHATAAGHSEHWADPTTHAERVLTYGADGRPLVDMGRSVAPGLDDAPPSLEGEELPLVPSRFVDHCLGQYADREQPYLSVGTPAESFLRWLGAGAWVMDGTEVVDGRALLRLVLFDPAMEEATGTISEHADDQAAEATAVGSGEVMYVDPETHLPVLHVAGGSRTEIELLPRTAENLGLVVPPVPDGFARVETPALDDQRIAHGCG